MGFLNSNKKVKKILSTILSSRFAIIIIIGIITGKTIDFAYWKNEKGVIGSDIIWFYSYLPAKFIYNDITLEFVGANRAMYYGKFFTGTKERTGTYVIKTSMGMAMLYSPFFFIADTFAKNSSKYERTGFSSPYKLMLLISCIFYLLLGLIALRTFLRKYFDDWLVALTLIIIVLGTNLYHYTINEAPMTHAYSFSLISVFLLFTYKWHSKASIFNSVITGLIIGLIALIRPTNIIVILVFVLWDVHSFIEIKNKFFLFFKNYKYIFIISLTAFLIWVPQFFYWKMQTGGYLFYSYNHERFYFYDPKILEVLFSYRKGWLVYTPVMILSFVGIPFMFKKMRNAAPGVTFIIPIHIFIISSWWCWWYGGSFGMRPMIDIYGLLAIPIISFFNYIRGQKLIFKILVLFFIAFCLHLNLLNTWQYNTGIIHYDSMTKKTFWKTFFKNKKYSGFYNDLEKPDYEYRIKESAK